MIPIKDDNPQINIPYGTYIIIILNILSWIFIQNFGSEGNLNYSICKYGLIPNTLFNEFKDTNCEKLNLGNYFSILSSMFMHGGYLIIGNLFFSMGLLGNVETQWVHKTYYFYIHVNLHITQVYIDVESVIPMVEPLGNW